MQTISNAAKQSLSAGKLTPGIGVRVVRGVEVARIMKTAGFEWLFIDLEHGQTSVESAYQISLAALDAGIAPLVRVPNGDLRLATRCLDGGALGIVMPHVDTADEARGFVDACRFPEAGKNFGHRSIAGGYPQFGFASQPAAEAMAAMNAATLLVVMLETPRAIENAAAIAAVPGIDVLLIGTNDLCLEMGIAGQLTHERVVAAYETTIKACNAHGKWPGMGGVYSQDLLKRYIAMGMRMILCGNDLSLLLPAAQNQAGFVRACA